MPPRFKFTKQKIIDEALDLVKERGFDFLSARNLANKLGTSSKVIFGSFKNMEELETEVCNKASLIFQQIMLEALTDRSQPAYLSCGLAFIKFAKEETNLFKVISNKDLMVHITDESLDQIYKVIMEKSHLTYTQAQDVHFRYWVFMLGLVNLIINNSFELNEEQVRNLLCENYKMLVSFYHQEKIGE